MTPWQRLCPTIAFTFPLDEEEQLAGIVGGSCNTQPLQFDTIRRRRFALDLLTLVFDNIPLPRKSLLNKMRNKSLNLNLSLFVFVLNPDRFLN